MFYEVDLTKIVKKNIGKTLLFTKKHDLVFQAITLACFIVVLNLTPKIKGYMRLKIIFYYTVAFSISSIFLIEEKTIFHFTDLRFS